MLPLEAVRSREGAAYLGGAALAALVAALLLVDGVDTYLRQSAYRNAIQAFAQGDRNTRGLLLELQADYPQEATWPHLLGVKELESADFDPQHLDSGERLFQAALELDSGRSSSLIGLAVTQLRRAEGRASRDARAEAVSETERLLRQAPSEDNADLHYLRGALELARGNLQAAEELLAEETEMLPSAEGVASRHWNRAATAILLGDGRALEYLLPAYVARRFELPEEPEDEKTAKRYEPALLLSLAYRASLVAGATPADLDSQRARCDLAVSAASFRHTVRQDTLGPFLPPERELPRIWNALGLALLRVERYEEAIRYLDDACRGTQSQEPLYLRNLAEALRLGAEHEEEGRAARLARSASTFLRFCELLKGKAGREPQITLAMTNAAAILVRLKKLREALSSYRRLMGVHPQETLRHRDLGALLDHLGNRECVEEYRRAILGGHPDAASLDRRLSRYRR